MVRLIPIAPKRKIKVAIPNASAIASSAIKARRRGPSTKVPSAATIGIGPIDRFGSIEQFGGRGTGISTPIVRAVPPRRVRGSRFERSPPQMTRSARSAPKPKVDGRGCTGRSQLPPPPVQATSDAERNLTGRYSAPESSQPHGVRRPGGEFARYRTRFRRGLLSHRSAAESRIANARYRKVDSTSGLPVSAFRSGRSNILDGPAFRWEYVAVELSPAKCNLSKS